MVWATVDDVLAITGEVVEQSSVDQATVLIELHVGRTMEDLPSPTGRDGRWLKIAVAYQAVRQAQSGEVEGLAIDEVQSLSIDGLAISLKHRENSAEPTTLSKLAWRACRNLSWMRVRGQKIGLGHDRMAEYVHETIEFDEDTTWTNWRPI